MRESKRQRTARVEAVIVEYDRVAKELRQLQRRADELKEALRGEPLGVYGGWVLTAGTERELLDQGEARRLLAAAGIAVPVISAKPPVVVVRAAAA